MSQMDKVLQGFVDKREAAGVSALVYKGGKELYFGAYGVADVKAGKPFTRDTLCRVYSMSKVITSAAMLILMESGACQLDDPVSKYIPEYADIKVAHEDKHTGKITFAPAIRPMTIRHLLTMQSGMSYGDNQETPVREAVSKICRQEMERLTIEDASGNHMTAAKLARAMAKIPLNFDPGEYWLYGVSLDVIGGLIEIITGKSLGEYMSEKIFEPLGMRNTAFHFGVDKFDRIAKMYTGSGDSLAEFTDDGIMTNGSEMHSGGGGLISTIDDYATFARMLLNNGELNGVRIMSAHSVKLMTTDELTTPQLKHSFNWLSERGYTYGLAVRVMQNPAESDYKDAIGAFGWNGMAGTSVRIDPANDTVSMFFVQHVPGEHELFLPDFMSAVRALERGE